MNYLHWCCNGESVRGASHERTGLVNQDALHHETLQIGQERWLLLSVSDGHGGSTYFRSQIGARYAVESAAIVVKQLAHLDPVDLKAELPKAIVEQWQTKVIQHVQHQPFTQAEWQTLDSQELWQTERLKSQLEQDPTLIYGATLLIVLITPRFGLYFQLGDGDILWVDQSGNAQHVLPKDDRQIANQTLSLCTPQAYQEAQVRLIPHSEAALPALILVATDGYANSFATEDDFLKIGADYLRSLRRSGFERVIAQLSGILTETSRRGSGDDMTLGMIYFEEARSQPTASEARSSKRSDIQTSTSFEQSTTLSTVLSAPESPSSRTRTRWIWLALISVLFSGAAVAVFQFVPLPFKTATPSKPPIKPSPESSQPPSSVAHPQNNKSRPTPKPKATPKSTPDSSDEADFWE